MKIGFILECTQDGADVHVCTHLVKMINELHQMNIDMAQPVTLTNKPGLIQRCGKAAKGLLETEKCDRVVIVWDQDSKISHGKSNCLGQDRDDIFAALKIDNVDLEKVFLVGIKRELESWLIADGRAIEGFLSDLKKRSVGRIRGAGRPEEVADPKSWITNVFREHGIQRYRDYEHAQKIVKKLTDFREIKTSETFVRFVLKVADLHL